MLKQWRLDFYRAFGEVISEEMGKRKMTPYSLAESSGEQFNTIKRIMEGKPFHYHHVVWITEILNLSMDSVIQRLLLVTRTENRVARLSRTTEIKKIKTNRKVKMTNGVVDIDELV